MANKSTDHAQPVEDASARVRDERRGKSAGERGVRQQPIENPENGLTADEEVLEVSAAQPLAVRETGRLYRLKSARFVAVVAADTEQEARWLAATHDALRGDWRSLQFATAEFEDTGEAHVFGDVIISALAISPWSRKGE